VNTPVTLPAEPSVFVTAAGVDFAIVGVGGQGVILASDLLSQIGLRAGLDVKKTDSLGMSQRGGSVVSFVRWGQDVRSMLPSLGSVHVVLALESLEAARYAEWLRPGGVSLVSEQVITPVSVSAGVDAYPTREQVTAAIEGRGARALWLPCDEIAMKAGSSRAANVVMLGAPSTFLDLPEAAWTSAISELLPKRIVEVNLRAFAAGRRAAEESQLGKDLRA
jgi:indolepyruvate ferredoxin oxidoreductase, beta subunit